MKTKVVVASLNPVKIKSSEMALNRMFPRKVFEISGVSVPSGVSNQPISETETLRGALNRAKAALELFPKSYYSVGIEGGVEEREHGMEAFAWIVVLSNTGKIGRGRTGTFFLPDKVAELIRGGMELGLADDQIFNRSNSKQKNGAVGILTGNVIDRTKYYVDAITLALIPFKNPKLYR